MIENATSTPVWYLYVAPCWSDSWGPELLGNNVLLGGGTATISEITPDCYDVRAVGEYEIVEWRQDDIFLNAGETYWLTLTL